MAVVTKKETRILELVRQRKAGVVEETVVTTHTRDSGITVVTIAIKTVGDTVEPILELWYDSMALDAYPARTRVRVVPHRAALVSRRINAILRDIIGGAAKVYHRNNRWHIVDYWGNDYDDMLVTGHWCTVSTPTPR